MDSIIKSIINKIKATETKIYEKTGEELNLLAAINYTEPALEKDADEMHAKSIFKVLIEIPNFFERFNRIAKEKYQKISTIKIGHFKGYAQAYHLPSRWVYSCAIDVIAEHECPLTIINEDDLFSLWIKPSLRAGVNKQDLMEKLKNWSARDELLDKVKNYELPF